LSPGVVTFFSGRRRPLRMSWLVLGTSGGVYLVPLHWPR
jgi:hypothetical protein